MPTDRSDLALPSPWGHPGPAPRRAWIPILEGADAERALRIGEDIGLALAGQAPRDLGPSLAGGASGLAMFFAYLGLAQGEGLSGPCAGLAGTWMERALEASPRVGDNLGLHTGHTGIAWALDHLEGLGHPPWDEDINDVLDETIAFHLDCPATRWRAELIDGLAGVGLYLLDRRGRGRSAGLLARVLDLLVAKSERSQGTATWYEAPETLFPEMLEAMPGGLYNLGVSHGIPGIIGFLAQAAGRVAGAGALLDAAVPWLLGQKDHHADGSFFGAGFGRRDLARNPDGHPLAWCYGDLGIALVLLAAARRRANPAWEEEAVALALACALRQDPRRGVEDACLCHGAFGNAHLFNRLFQATGEPALREAALGRYRLGFGMRTGPSSCAGFLPRNHDPGFPDRAFELLCGISGIGLALLAGATAVEPAWDRILLADVEPLGS